MIKKKKIKTGNIKIAWMSMYIQPTKYADDHLWYLNMQAEE